MPPPTGTGPAPGAARYLLRGERLVEDVHWHPIWLLPAALQLVGALLLIGWVAGRLEDGSSLGDPLGYLSLAVSARFAWKVWQWRTERLIITDRRLLLVTGILTRRLAVLPLRKVTDLTFLQPPVGRLFNELGWGTFIFESAGQDQGLSRVPYLPRPDDLYQRLSDEIFGEGGLYGSTRRVGDTGD